MYNNKVYLTKFPNPCDLLCVFATINSCANVNNSYYNEIILKCRQLIFEISDVIACPQTDQIFGIYIVVKEDFYKTGELHSYLKKHSLRSESAQAVHKYIFEKCCLYTIISKLSPNWNQISNYLVQGRNFLIDQGPTNSVQFKFIINDKGNTTININVNCIKLSKITLDNLFLTNDELKQLHANQYIHFKQCNIRSIQVLPSLKRGKIIALHLKLNRKTSIKNYQEMRRYWKNTYGYRLPETDENIFYVDISFFEGSQIFTYPNLCVGFYEPTFTQRIDPNPIVTEFMVCLKKYVPAILGENYPDPTPSLDSNSTPNLLTASQMVNLSSSCKINSAFKETDKPCERVLKDENNKLPNQREESKSKLSQLLEELNKNHNKSTIYLTPQPTSNKNNFNHIDLIDKSNEIGNPITENTNGSKNEVKPKSISEDLKKQLDFLTTSISQSQQTNIPKSFTLKFKNRSANTNINTKFKNPIRDQEEIHLKRDSVSLMNENVAEKKRKIDCHENSKGLI